MRSRALAALLIFVPLPHEGGGARGGGGSIELAIECSEISPCEHSMAHQITVIDGDTIRVASHHQGIKWRLVGFDTPEIEHARCADELAKGLAAKARLEDHFADARKVIVLIPSGKRDRYGRSLGRLIVGGQDVSELMIGEGLARAYAGGTRQGWC